MDDLRTRLDALESQIHTLQQHTHTMARRLRWWRGLAGGLLGLAVLTWALPSGTAQEDTMAGNEKGKKGLEQRVAALESLLKHFRRNGNEVFIKGANLHIVNGLGSTDCTDEEEKEIPDCPNGLGNLIVGYNEPRAFEPEVRTVSHNVVVGQRHHFSRFGGLVVGDVNTISGDFAAVSGGTENTASGQNSSVCGGFINTASGQNSSVCGGQGNEASGRRSSVSGGSGSTASGDWSSVSGGANNTASGQNSSVSGGGENMASGNFSWTGGGLENTASGDLVLGERRAQPDGARGQRLGRWRPLRRRVGAWVLWSADSISHGREGDTPAQSFRSFCK